MKIILVLSISFHIKLTAVEKLRKAGINGLTDSLHDKGLVLKTASHPACGSQFA